MNEPGVYVVRIYRRDAIGIIGVVESVTSGECAPFATADALWHALQVLPSSRRESQTGHPQEE